MDYFRILNLSREPFSNSPDPDFFFQSQQHVKCLQKIELSVRLRRGLNVIIGDVGTGKTTLCRRLIRNFSNDEKVESHLILDPYFSTPTEFLVTVAGMFGENRAESQHSDWQFKESIKNYLFRRGVDEKKTVVLIIDEGQKLPDFCLEILREFLNYETNDQKLLQIVIFAQEEFQQGIKEHQNFADRINLYHILGPLNFRETRSMIRCRLELASDGEKGPSFFSFWALRVIYKASGGYPRKIINLCHRVMLTLIIQNRTRVSRSVARFCVNEAFPDLPKTWHPVRIAVLTGSLMVVLVFAVAPEHLSIPIPWEKERRVSLSQLVKTQIRVKQPIVRIKKTSTQSLERGSADAAVSMETVEPPVIGESEAPVIEEEAYAVSLETADSDKEIPDNLGQIIVHKRDTLGNLMYRVYGIYDRKYLRLVAERNPEIKNPNLIEPGQLIRFPAVPVEVSPSLLKFWWVKITTKDRLEDAYRFLRSHSDDIRHLGIIPCWNRRDGLKFMVLYRKYFQDEESARRVLKELPAELVAGAKIQAEWDEDTVFFSNPVF
jgi:general secretion pathway protein A